MLVADSVLRKPCEWALTAFVLCVLPVGFSQASIALSTTEGLFDLYELNRAESRPNYITEDLFLVTYGMIRVSVGRSLEREKYSGQVSRLIHGLQARVESDSTGDRADQANRDYLAVLVALLDGRREVAKAGKAKRAQAELDLVLAANSMKASPLWGGTLDYTQFRPRGHYQSDENLQRYFRAVRYAGAVLFAVKASRATRVGKRMAARMSLQARRLAQAIDQDPALSALHTELLNELTWRFGPPEDIPNQALLAVKVDPSKSYGQRLLQMAQTRGLQPRILSGVVDGSRLEKGVTAKDALTGWRLLPQRRTPDSAAFQQLVFDGPGEYQGSSGVEQDNAPFALAIIDGRAVKGFPLLAELMAAWGSEASRSYFVGQEEKAFAGYDGAFARAQEELAAATGLAALHQQFIQAGLGGGTCCVSKSAQERATTMRAFWTWQRYASVLYAKQSYTPAGKGLPLERPGGAWLEPSLVLYQALARVVEGHRAFTPHPSWDAFAALLDRAIDIASRELLSGVPTEQDEAFLNGLDLELKALAGGNDRPIVVDVHTNPASREVLQQATGRAVVAQLLRDGKTAWGARLTQCEFKHPMADRLTDTSWWELLDAEDSLCGNRRQAPGASQGRYVKVAESANAEI